MRLPLITLNHMCIYVVCASELNDFIIMHKIKCLVEPYYTHTNTLLLVQHSLNSKHTHKRARSIRYACICSSCTIRAHVHDDFRTNFVCALCARVLWGVHWTQTCASAFLNQYCFRSRYALCVSAFVFLCMSISGSLTTTEIWTDWRCSHRFGRRVFKCERECECECIYVQ